MRIKRVEIIGFKSFCDRAVVNLDSSITAVVGPNGCGKSNIVDAIRWCMGEQSAKHLRGKAMEDVIFAGSDSRGPAQMAEVSLTFDEVGFSHETLALSLNSDEGAILAQAESAIGEPVLGELSEDGAEDGGDAEDVEPIAVAPAVWTDEAGNPIPSPLDEANAFLADEVPDIDFTKYTEVTITRRLFRDGASLYFINKTPCRLRDITEFFMGTGVGTKAYAIIEQGRIGQIVSSRPQDRRLIIEEAAGITKFKSKKRAAEKKLEQTRQNLLRVSDIVAELDKRMGTLRRQAQKAERFRKYKGELRDIDLWRASHRFLELRAEGALVEGRLVGARTELADSRTAFDTKDAHVVAERAELAVEERRILGIQEVLYELDNRITLSESKRGFERREADELEARADQAEREIEDVRGQLAAATEELTLRQTELDELVGHCAREGSTVAEREALASEAKQMLVNAQARLDELRAAIARCRAEAAAAAAQEGAIIGRREEIGRRRDRLAGEVEGVSSRTAEVEREAHRVAAELATLRQTKLALGDQAESFKARKDLLTDETQRGQVEVETLRTEVHRRTSRLASLTEIQERYEGFARGTRSVMQQGGELDSSLPEGAIRGLVADVIRAPETLEIAVEAALGDRLGGVLVADAGVGATAIAYLKRSSSGRSAFVPVSRFADSDVPRLAHEAREGVNAAGVFDAERAGTPAGQDGVLGRMSDLVQFEDGYRELGHRLLGDIVVVDSLARAIALHDGGAGGTLVTVDGDLVDGRGVVAGGSREAQGSGVLAQKREIRDLEEIVGALEVQFTDATARLLTARTELANVVKALDGIRSESHSGDLAIMGHEKDDSRLRVELERSRERARVLGFEQLELDSRLATFDSETAACQERRDAAEARAADLEREQLDMLERVTSGRDRLDELVAELSDAKILAAQLGEKRAAIEAQTMRLQQTDVELNRRVGRLIDEQAAARVRSGELRADIERLGAELEIARARRTEEGLAMEAGRTAYEQRLHALGTVELEARELRSTADKLATEVSQLDLRIANVDMNRRVLVQGVDEKYQLDIAEVLYDFHLRAPIGEVDDARAAELRELLERMGTDINLTAIDEFAEVSQRFEFLSAQRNDLDRAVDQLQKAIDKINKTSRKLFKDTFTAINATFKEVFPRLFRGGQAALSLSGGDDVDLLEAGIEIMAQPPGKKNSTVEQLSGGEKALTAVALVFSIFLIKPSPFCILDEVDAPLDEANVDRYNEIVREMTDRSQFIVISHNKRTMESADNLYGVTMQEAGVSKLVTVNLSKLGVAAKTAAA